MESKNKHRMTSLFGGQVVIMDLTDHNMEDLPKIDLDHFYEFPDSIKEVANANHVIIFTNDGMGMHVLKSRCLRTPTLDPPTKEESSWFGITRQKVTETIEEVDRLRKWMQRILRSIGDCGWPDNENHVVTRNVARTVHKSLLLALEGRPQDHPLGNTNPHLVPDREVPVESYKENFDRAQRVMVWDFIVTVRELLIDTSNNKIRNTLRAKLSCLWACRFLNHDSFSSASLWLDKHNLFNEEFTKEIPKWIDEVALGIRDGQWPNDEPRNI